MPTFVLSVQLRTLCTHRGKRRTIVKRGLEYLANTEILGLNYLIDKAKLDRNALDSTGIAFRIAPVINASGRFGSPLQR